jgi:Xaa-Pro dipeptidase
MTRGAWDMSQRIDALRRRMVSDEIDLLIASSDGRQMLDRPDAVVYLSGYASWGESLALLYREGTVKLIVSPLADAERVEARRDLPGSVATDDLTPALAAELAELKFPTSRMATAGIDRLPHRLAAELIALTGGGTRNFDNVLYRIDGRKTAAEIESAREATRIAESGFDRLLALGRPGMTECALAVQLNGYTKSLGADDNFLMLSASPHNRAVMPSSSRKLEHGDILLAEFSPCVERQFAQICRTAVIGAASAELQRKYDLVLRAMWAGIEAIRPGLPVSQICRAIDRVMEAAGEGEFCRPPHMRRRGHGLGCGSIAPGDIAVDNETVLEEDMVFVVHPNQYVPAVGYLLCGEPVRVTATGVETLSRRTAALGVIRTEQKGFSSCA